MEFSTDNLERAVCQFYESNSDTQVQAHEWLQKAKNSPEAWTFVWELLQPQRSAEAQFFAATTLHSKIKKSLNELTPDNVIALREKLLTTLIGFSPPVIVLSKLCVSLASYFLQTCPERWPNALPSLFSTFSPENFPQVPEDRILFTFLEILVVLPEEFACAHWLPNQKGLVRHHLMENTPSVMTLIEKLLTNYTHEGVVFQAVRCAASWITIGVSFMQYENLPNVLVNLVFNTHKHQPRVCEKALECLRVIVDQPENHKYPTHLLDFLAKILPLNKIIAEELAIGNPVDQELICSVYNLFLTFGGTHSRQCLNWIKQGEQTREQVMTLITSILQCSGAKGHYPTEETYSRLTFGFWYILQDEIVLSSPQDCELYMEYLGPIYKELVNVLIMKAQLPDSEDNFLEEDLESFRCYRQDISDTLMYCHSILRENTISLIQTKLESINVDQCKWQELEAILFSLGSISENADLEENNFLFKLFQYIRNLPFERLNPKVFSTALDTIGAYADWISAHSSVLAYVLPLIILGLDVPEATSSATLALKDLTRDCPHDIKPYSSLILNASKKALHGGGLKFIDSQRLMCTVGSILSVLPFPTIMHYLDVILIPYVDRLNSLALLEPSNEIKNEIVMCLKMLAVLNGSLNTNTESPLYKDTANQPSPPKEPQPVLVILQKLQPVIKLIVNSWSADEYVMQYLFSLYKHSVTTLLEEAQPMVTDILDLIVSTYRIHPQPAAIDLSKLLCTLFGKDAKYEAMMQSLTNELCSVTMNRVSSIQSFLDLTDLLESMFSFLAQIMKKVPKLILCANYLSIFQCVKNWANAYNARRFFTVTTKFVTKVIQMPMYWNTKLWDKVLITIKSSLIFFATITLTIPELPTVKAAASFLVNFISQSGETESLRNVVNVCGQQLDLQIVSCIAGEAYRTHIEPLAHILLALNKNYYENHSQWLRQAVTESICPRTSIQQRESFITSVLMGVKSKAYLQETIKKFSLICRGIVGTEYAQSGNS